MKFSHRRMWNVIKIEDVAGHGDIPCPELVRETLVRRYYLSEEADAYVEKHDYPGTNLIVTRRRPAKNARHTHC